MTAARTPARPPARRTGRGLALLAVLALAAPVAAAVPAASASTSAGSAASPPRRCVGAAPVLVPAGTVGSTPSGAMVAADLDGDGDQDLAVAGGDSREVTVLLRGDDGRFARSTTPKISGSRANDLAAGDVDGDGDLDLVVATSGALGLLRNDGTGRFTPATIASPGSVGVALADLDADGDLDVVTADGSRSLLHVLTQTAPDRWTTTVLGEPGNEVDLDTTSDVAVADLDGDGSPELALSRYDANGVRVWSRSAAGWVDRGTWGTGDRPQQLATGQVDGTGPVDLVSSDERGSGLTVPRSDHRLTERVDTATTGTRLTTADLDADGADEVVVVGDEELVVARRTGPGAYDLVRTRVPVDGRTGLAALDVDGDGDLDVAVTTASGGLQWLRNDTPCAPVALPADPGTPGTTPPPTSTKPATTTATKGTALRRHAASRARVVGAKRVGATVRARFVDADPAAGRTVTYRWRVLGTGLRLTGRRVVLPAGAAGHRLRVVVSISAPGFEDQALRSPRTAVVRR